MKKITLVLLLLLPFFRIYAQEGNGYAIRGSVQGPGLQGLADELVYLCAQSDSALVKSEFTDAQGAFRFLQLKAGSYFICIKNPDFDKYCSAEIRLEHDLDLPAISLKQGEKELKEVAVVGKKPFIERLPGKMVVNVEQSIQSNGFLGFRTD